MASVNFEAFLSNADVPVVGEPELKQPTSDRRRKIAEGLHAAAVKAVAQDVKLPADFMRELAHYLTPNALFTLSLLSATLADDLRAYVDNVFQSVYVCKGATPETVIRALRARVLAGKVKTVQAAPFAFGCVNCSYSSMAYFSAVTLQEVKVVEVQEPALYSPTFTAAFLPAVQTVLPLGPHPEGLIIHNDLFNGL